MPSFVQSEEPLDEPKEGSRSVFPGARVLLHGLQQQWEINGQKGTVVATGTHAGGHEGLACYAYVCVLHPSGRYC